MGIDTQHYGWLAQPKEQPAKSEKKCFKCDNKATHLLRGRQLCRYHFENNLRIISITEEEMDEILGPGNYMSIEQVDLARKAFLEDIVKEEERREKEREKEQKKEAEKGDNEASG